MSPAIGFLASLGSKPLSATEYAAAVATLDVNEPQRAALIERDVVALNGLLDGRPKLYFAVCAPDEQDAPTPDRDQPDEEEAPASLPGN